MKTFLSKQKNKIITVIMLVAVLTTIFILPSNAYDGVNIQEISTENIIGNKFTMKTVDNELMFNLWDLIPVIRDNANSVNKQFALQFYSNDKQFRGIDISWSIDPDINKPVVSIGYAYVTWVNSFAFMPMIQPVLTFIINSNSSITVETDNTDTYKEITIVGGLDYTDGNLITVLNTLYIDYNTFHFDDDSNIINQINNNNAQNEYSNFYNILVTIANNNNLSGVTVLFYIMASVIDTRLQLAIQFIILFAMGILVFKLLTRIVSSDKGGKK